MRLLLCVLRTFRRRSGRGLFLRLGWYSSIFLQQLLCGIILRCCLQLIDGLCPLCLLVLQPLGDRVDAEGVVGCDARSDEIDAKNDQ